MIFRRNRSRRRPRSLVQIQADLARARDDLRVAEEQFLAVDAVADEAQVQMVMDETVLSARNNKDASRHAELMRDQMARARVRVDELQRAEAAARDALLDP